MNRWNTYSIFIIFCILICSAYSVASEVNSTPTDEQTLAPLPAVPEVDNPDDELSRYQWVAMLVDVFMHDICNETPSDNTLYLEKWNIPIDHWTRNSFTCLADNEEWIWDLFGCTTYWDDFQGNRNLDRYYIAVWLDRFITSLSDRHQLSKEDISVFHCDDTYVDIEPFHYAEDSIWFVCGILPGYPDKTFRGENYITVNEFRDALQRIVDNINEQSPIIAR